MMDIEPQTLREYVTPDGKNPFRNWLDALRDVGARARRTVVLLLCGGDKSSQKRDVATAKEYWLDYQKRSS